MGIEFKGLEGEPTVDTRCCVCNALVGKDCEVESVDGADYALCTTCYNAKFDLCYPCEECGGAFIAEPFEPKTRREAFVMATIPVSKPTFFGGVEHCEYCAKHIKPTM